MKIATFNINNVNRRLPNLLDWLKTAGPDIVCLQELKCPDEQFLAEALRRAGYHAVWRGQRTWNGVAILSRRGEPILTRTDLPGDPNDAQARYIEAAISGIVVGCLYLPNGNPQPVRNSTTSSPGSNVLARMRASGLDRGWRVRRPLPLG